MYIVFCLKISSQAISRPAAAAVSNFVYVSSAPFFFTSEFFLLIHCEALCLSAVHVFVCASVDHTCMHYSSKLIFVRKLVY